jgi:hypothetical protein
MRGTRTASGRRATRCARAAGPPIPVDITKCDGPVVDRPPDSITVTFCGSAQSSKPGVGQRGTLPAFRHEVQTLSRFGVPLTTVRTRWMFGLKRRLVRRWLWETLLPKPGPLAQISQTAATGTPVCEGRGALGVSQHG